MGAHGYGTAGDKAAGSLADHRRRCNRRRFLSAACLASGPPNLITAPKYGRRWRRRRRWSQIAHPDRSVVELDGHAIRRIDGALVPGVDPDPRRRRKQVRPCAGGLTGFVEKIEVGSVLGDESGTADG